MDFDDLDRFARKNRIKAVTIWKSDSRGWQGNAQNADGSWRVMYGDTPGDAIQSVIESYRQYPSNVVHEGKPKNLVPVQQELELKAKRVRRNDDIL